MVGCPCLCSKVVPALLRVSLAVWGYLSVHGAHSGFPWYGLPLWAESGQGRDFALACGFNWCSWVLIAEPVASDRIWALLLLHGWQGLYQAYIEDPAVGIQYPGEKALMAQAHRGFLYPVLIMPNLGSLLSTPQRQFPSL